MGCHILRRTHLWYTLFLLTILGLTFIGFVPQAAAHAFLERSDPAPGAIVPLNPRVVKLRFTDPIEAAYSSAILLDATGGRVATLPAYLGPDSRELILPLPPDLQRGTYTVQWRNVSAADGHPNAGFFSFTIGTLTDVTDVVPPPVRISVAPTSLSVLARFLQFLGLAFLLGPLVFWYIVASPAIPHSALLTSHLIRRFRRLVLAGGAVSVLALIMFLIVQLWNSVFALDFTQLPGLLFSTRLGYLWLVRLGLTLLIVIVFHTNWAILPGRSSNRVVLLSGAALLVLTTALVSHSAAEERGQAAAVVNDWVHLAAALTWAGGLISLYVSLHLLRRLSTAPPVAPAVLIRRFSNTALAAVLLLLTSGFYHAWLFIGNVTALRLTSYGMIVGAKVGLATLEIIIGAVNLLILGPRAERSAASIPRIARASLIEFGFLVLVLLTSGIAVTLPPARTVLEQAAREQSFYFAEGGLHVQVSVSPAAVGINTVTIDIASTRGPLPDETQVLLRLTPPSELLQGTREIALTRENTASRQYLRYSRTSSDFGVAGEWSMEVVIRQPNMPDWQARTPLSISQIPATAALPAPAPRFHGLVGALGLLALHLTLPLLVIGFRDRRREFVYVSAVAVLLAIPTLALTRVELRNPIPATADSIARGRQLYASHCARCHGEYGLGNGPDAFKLNWPLENMNLQAHLHEHSDEQVFWWIKEGKAGTPMPAFGRILTDEEIWHLINYIRTLTPS